MQTLLTGGAGYIGSQLSSFLLNSGHRVRVLDNLSRGGESLLGVWSHPGFEFIAGDVRERAVVTRALAGAEAVVHLAAVVGDPACARDPERARAVNLEASHTLLDLSIKAGASRFVFASTCSNYGRMPDPDQYVTEDSELRPVSLYAETKVAFEQTLAALPGDRPAATVLRFATVFGVSPRMRFDLTVNQFAMQMVRSGRLVLYGGRFWRPYVHVRDAARAVALVLERPLAEVCGQVFNVGDNSQNYQKEQIVELIGRQLDHQAVIEAVEQPDDPRDYRVNFDKIRTRLGFRITRTVPEGIREVIELVRDGAIADVAAPRFYN